MIRVLVAIALYAVSVPVASGQTPYCALEVTVRSPSGHKMPGIPVLIGQGNKSVFAETKTGKNGIARICDAPLAFVDVVVGFSVCGSVTVRSVAATWPYTRKVGVTYVKDSCPEFIFTDQCLALLRIQDDQGHPLSGARFDQERGVSDNFGRLFQPVKCGEKIEGTILKEGFTPARLSEECLDNLELKVVLHGK
jgi:hypothetical protein